MCAWTQRRIPVRFDFHAGASGSLSPNFSKRGPAGTSFIREPNGIPLTEAGAYQEEMITAVLDLERADRSYIRDSLKNPPFLAKYWAEMVRHAEARKDLRPE